MKEALSSFKTFVPTRATRRNIPEDAILHVALSRRFFVEPWPTFQYRIHIYIYSKQDSFDVGSAYLKAATYTKDSTNAE
jgi:hypothetical protein